LGSQLTQWSVRRSASFRSAHTRGRGACVPHHQTAHVAGVDEKTGAVELPRLQLSALLHGRGRATCTGVAACSQCEAALRRSAPSAPDRDRSVLARSSAAPLVWVVQCKRRWRGAHRLIQRARLRFRRWATPSGSAVRSDDLERPAPEPSDWLSRAAGIAHRRTRNRPAEQAGGWCSIAPLNVARHICGVFSERACRAGLNDAFSGASNRRVKLTRITSRHCRRNMGRAAYPHSVMPPRLAVRGVASNCPRQRVIFDSRIPV
jgi:hypothetical protein